MKWNTEEHPNDTRRERPINYYNGSIAVARDCFFEEIAAAAAAACCDYFSKEEILVLAASRFEFAQLLVLVALMVFVVLVGMSAALVSMFAAPAVASSLVWTPRCSLTVYRRWSW